LATHQIDLYLNLRAGKITQTEYDTQLAQIQQKYDLLKQTPVAIDFIRRSTIAVENALAPQKRKKSK